MSRNEFKFPLPRSIEASYYRGMTIRHRPRRLRQSPEIRSIVAETSVQTAKLIWPIFVCEGKKIKKAHPHVPGLLTVSLDQLNSSVQKAFEKGIKCILLFGVVSKKDSEGSYALNKNGIVPQAIRAIRKNFPEILIATDIALDPYTDHGHDGVFDGAKVLNDETVDILCKMSVLHAKSGAHIVAPSDMMDGRVAAIRSALDAEGFMDISIMAYSAKYASCLYGPFRDTLNAKVKGDKKTYQMNPANRREAIRELELDISESADFVMVKPASWYLDIISDFKAASNVPVVAYQVSGECAMIELAASEGLLDRQRAIHESLLSIFRAGADFVITYFALDLGE